MPNEKEFKKNVGLIELSMNSFEEIKGDDEISKPYSDEFTTKEQRCRDRKITKYIFPVNDEEYITRIVELIQNNDLENKKGKY